MFIIVLAFPDPPNSSPVITVSPSLADIVYEGDNITVRCTVSGGKPVNATVIMLACPYKTHMTPGSSDSSSISSSLMFLPVRSENHGRCACNAKWKRSDWYNKTVSWNLTVYCELLSDCHICLQIDFYLSLKYCVSYYRNSRKYTF